MFEEKDDGKPKCLRKKEKCESENQKLAKDRLVAGIPRNVSLPPASSIRRNA